MKTTNNNVRYDLRMLNSLEMKERVQALYDNAVLAVRETEAILHKRERIDVRTTKVNWRDAVELHSDMRGSTAFFNDSFAINFRDVEVDNACELEELVQDFCIDYYMFNFAYENAVVYRLNELKQYIEKGIKPQPLNFNKMDEFCLSIKNENGDFVYFADSDEPIVVKGIGNKEGSVSLVELAKEMEVA